MAISLVVAACPLASPRLSHFGVVSKQLSLRLSTYTWQHVALLSQRADIDFRSPAFIEKMLNLDTEGRYFIRTVGEEPHYAYNRVGLTGEFHEAVPARDQC